MKKLLTIFIISTLFSCSSETSKTTNIETKPVRTITKTELGNDWCFSVDSGYVTCDSDALYFVAPNGLKYPLNGLAQSPNKLEDIWLWDDETNKNLDEANKVRKSIFKIMEIAKGECK